MQKNKYWCLCALIVLTATNAPVWPQHKLDAQTFKTFGGRYMSDCSKVTSPKVTVFEEALVLLDGVKRIAGSNVQAMASWYGRDVPPEYRVALLSETPGKQQLVFLVNQDKAGYYITLDGDAKLLAAIGKPLVGQRFRRCDSAPKSGSVTPAPKPKAYALTELDAGGFLLDAKAKSAYYKALGPLTREPWLARLDGPSPQNKLVKIAGTDYVLAGSCKNHDCAENNIVFLYSATQGIVYGKVFQSGKSTLLGAPTPVIASELEGLWRAGWRQR